MKKIKMGLVLCGAVIIAILNLSCDSFDWYPDGEIFNVWPKDGATDVPLNTHLYWQSNYNVSYYDVTLETGGVVVQTWAWLESDSSGNHGHCVPDELEPNTTYLWKIEAHDTNDGGGRIGFESDYFSFTTGTDTGGTGQVVWYYSPGNYTSDPLIINGSIYSSDGDGIYALNAADGSLLWEKGIPSYGTTVPVYAEDDLFTEAGDAFYNTTDVYRIDPDTGATIWVANEYGRGYTFYPAVDNGRVYAPAQRIGGGSELFCFDSSDGSQIWNLVFDDEAECSAAAGNDTVFICLADNSIRCLNGSDGSELWAVTGMVTDKMIYDSGALYLLSGVTAYCFDPDDGSQIWSYSGGSGLDHLSLQNGSVLFNGDNTLYCLNATTGTLRWSYDATDEITGEAALTADYIFFGANRFLYCLNVNDHSEVWNVRLDNSRSAAVYSNGYVYMAGTGGYLYCVNANPSKVHYGLSRSVIR